MILHLSQCSEPRLFISQQTRNGAPALVRQVEDLVLFSIVVRSAKTLLPILEVVPSLFWTSA